MVQPAAAQDGERAAKRQRSSSGGAAGEEEEGEEQEQEQEQEQEARKAAAEAAADTMFALLRHYVPHLLDPLALRPARQRLQEELADMARLLDGGSHPVLDKERPAKVRSGQAAARVRGELRLKPKQEQRPACTRLPASASRRLRSVGPLAPLPLQTHGIGHMFDVGTPEQVAPWAEAVCWRGGPVAQQRDGAREMGDACEALFGCRRLPRRTLCVSSAVVDLQQECPGLQRLLQNCPVAPRQPGGDRRLPVMGGAGQAACAELLAVLMTDGSLHNSDLRHGLQGGDAGFALRLLLQLGAMDTSRCAAAACCWGPWLQPPVAHID